MANTEEGARLTEAHRLAQLRNAGEALRVSATIWRLLDVRDLDGSTARWLEAQLAALGRYNERSRRLAEQYLRAYREAEAGGRAAVIPGGFIDQVAAIVSLETQGPIAAKENIARGVPPAAAMQTAWRRTTGAIGRLVQQGGRGTIDQTVRRDSGAVGYRRVTDSDPCEFCALLASRGPVFASEAGALQVGRGRTNRIRGAQQLGDAYHDNCNCSAEPVYGSWEPTEVERRLIDIYDDSVEPGDLRATLRNMRHALGRD